MNDEPRDSAEANDEDRPRPKPRVVDKRFSARPAGTAPAPATAPTPEDKPEQRPAGDAAPPPATEPPAAAQAPSAPHEAPGGPVWTPEQEAEARRMAEEIAGVHSRDWIVSGVMNLVNVAGVKLETGSLEEAQLTIDALAGLLKEVGPRLGDAEAPLRQVLSQLQMAYAQLAAAPTK